MIILFFNLTYSYINISFILILGRNFKIKTKIRWWITRCKKYIQYSLRRNLKYQKDHLENEKKNEIQWIRYQRYLSRKW